MNKKPRKLIIIPIAALAILVFSAPSCLAQTASSQDLYLEELAKKAAAANDGFTPVSKMLSSDKTTADSKTGSSPTGQTGSNDPRSIFDPGAAGITGYSSPSYTPPSPYSESAGGAEDYGTMVIANLKSASGSGVSPTGKTGSDLSSYITETGTSGIAGYSMPSYTPPSPNSESAGGAEDRATMVIANLKNASGSSVSPTGKTGSDLSSYITETGTSGIAGYSSPSYSAPSSDSDSDFGSVPTETAGANSSSYLADPISSSQPAQNYSYQQGSDSQDFSSSSPILGSDLELSQSRIDQFNSLPANSLIDLGKTADNQGLITQKTDLKNTSATMSYIFAGQMNALDSSKSGLIDSFSIENMDNLLANESNINENAHELLSSNKNKKTDSVNINDYIAKTAESILSVSFKADKSDQKADSSDSELLSNILKTESKNKSNVNLKGTDSIDTVDTVASNKRVKVDIIHKTTELQEEDVQAAMSGILPMLRNLIRMQAKLMIATHKVNLLLPPLTDRVNKNDPIEATARAKMSNSGNGKTKSSNSVNAKKDKIRLKKARIFELNIFRNLKCAFNYASTGLSPPEEDLLPISLSSGKRILPLFILSKEHRAYAQNSYYSHRIILNLINNRIKEAIYRSCRADLARRGLYSAPPEYGPQIFQITAPVTTMLQPPLELVVQPVMINHVPQMF